MSDTDLKSEGIAERLRFGIEGLTPTERRRLELQAASEISRLKSLLQDLIEKAEPFTSEASLMFSTWKDDESYFGNIKVGDLRSLSDAVAKAKEGMK